MSAGRSHPRPRIPPPPYYLILRGPLGAGKTTVARALARRSGGTVVSIDARVESEWDGGSESLFLRANIAAAAAARRAFRRGRWVIFDGNFYWRRALEDLVARLPHPHRILTLRVPLATCIARDEGRRLPHGREAARAVYAKVERMKRGSSVQADGSVGATVRAVERRIARDLPRSGSDARPLPPRARPRTLSRGGRARSRAAGSRSSPRRSR